MGRVVRRELCHAQRRAAGCRHIHRGMTAQKLAESLGRVVFVGPTRLGRSAPEVSLPLANAAPIDFEFRLERFNFA